MLIGCSKKASLKSLKRTKAGFTLVEVVVAMLILLIAASGILASFLAARRYIARAKRRIIAINFARQKTEQLVPWVRWDYWEDAATNPLYAATGGSQSYPTNDLPNCEFTYKWSGARSYTVTDSSAAGFPDSYRSVSVTVTWNEPSM